MSDLLWKVFEISVSLFESFVVIHFICAFLQHDFKTIKGKTIYLLGVLADFISVTVTNYLTEYEGICGVIYVLIYFLYSLFFLKGSLANKLFAASMANIVLVCTGSLVSGIMSAVFQSDFSQIYKQSSFDRIESMIINQAILVCIYNLILKYKVSIIKKKEWNLILSILAISFVSMAFLHFTLININIDINYTRMLIAAEFGIIILNIVCFYMTYEMSRSNAEAEKFRIQRQQDEFRIAYAENIREWYEEIRRMRHDMKQNFSVIAALYNEGKYNEAGEYAQSISDNLSNIDIIVDVKNVFINAILNAKLSIAKEYGIQVICTASSNINGIDDVDLCNLLGNMLDNALEAAKKCVDGYIEVSIYSDDDKILVIISNSISQSVLATNKELLSIKRDSGCHGYGVKTIRSIAQKYNGTASFYEDGNMFYCQVLMYKS